VGQQASHIHSPTIRVLCTLVNQMCRRASCASVELSQFLPSRFQVQFQIVLLNRCYETLTDIAGRALYLCSDPNHFRSKAIESTDQVSLPL